MKIQMKIKYEDFLLHKDELYKYALSLTKDNKYSYHKDKADDLLQNTYLAWHIYVDNKKDTEIEDIYKFIKTIMFRVNYKRFDIRNNSTKYNNYVVGIEDLKVFKTSNKINTDWIYKDLLFKLKNTKFANKSISTKYYPFIIDKILEGYTNLEIANEIGIEKNKVQEIHTKIRNKIKKLL